MSNATAPSGPTDAQLEAEIINYHPVFDVPGPGSVKGDVRISEPGLHSLPAASRDTINAKLGNAVGEARQRLESEYVGEELIRLAVEARVKAGVGQDATHYQRECYSIANEVRLLEAESASITEQLQAVSGYDAEVDPETGEPVAIPIVLVRGDNRTALEARLMSLRYQLSQTRREAEKRKTDAVERDKAAIRERNEAFAINAEADQRARDMIREKRINALAAGKAKRLTSNL